MLERGLTMGAAAVAAATENGGGGGNKTPNGKNILSLPLPRRPGCKNGGTDKRSSNVNRRRMEDNLAMIFMGIVAVFLLCHFPRIFLGLHEMVIAKESLACSDLSDIQYSLGHPTVKVSQTIIFFLNCFAVVNFIHLRK